MSKRPDAFSRNTIKAGHAQKGLVPKFSVKQVRVLSKVRGTQWYVVPTIESSVSVPDAPNVSEILEIAFIDELQTFVGKKILIRVTDNCQPFSARHLSLGFGRSLTRLARKL